MTRFPWLFECISAILGMGLTLLGCCSGCWNSTPIHKPFMGCHSPQDIRLDLILLKCPHPFSKGTGSDPYLRMMHVLVTKLAPQADLSSNHILFVFVVFNHFSNVLHIKIHPCLIIAIGNSQIIAYTHIQIEGTILRNDNRIVGRRKSSPPPMHDVSILYFNLVAIHPIHHLFVRI